MRKLLLFLISLIIINTTVCGQSTFTFRTVNVPSTLGMSDIKFIDSLRGIAINHYQIFSTVDAGENWSLKFSTPTTSFLNVINHVGDSIIVTGFYGTAGPTNLSFFFNDSTFLLDNQPNNHNITYTSPILFNDSMWSTEGRTNIGLALITIKDAAYRVIDSSFCYLDIYENRISFFNGSVIRYSLDSAKTWNTINNVPVFNANQQFTTQTYFDGDSTIYIQKQGNFLNNYEDSAFVSFNLGGSWTRITNTPLPNRLHFVDSNIIVGVDSGNFLFSYNKGISFSSIQVDSSLGSPELWVHSNNRYFVRSQNRGLLVVERDLLTNVEALEPQRPNFNIVPNPAGQSFQINLSEGSFDYIQIMDISGRIVEESVLPKTLWDVSDFPNGIYCVSIQKKGKGRMTRKMIVQH